MVIHFLLAFAFLQTVVRCNNSKKMNILRILAKQSFLKQK